MSEMTERRDAIRARENPRTSEEVERYRQHVRERSRSDAARGTNYRDHFDAQSLAAAFTAAELEELDQVVLTAREERRAAKERGERQKRLRIETDRVLAEWDAQRRADAEREARARLGWDDEA